MPPIPLIFFRDLDGSVPAIEWLGSLPAKARAKCGVALERLAGLGFELRRPEADLLRNGIYELRVRLGHVNYRMLYFFHERAAVVVSHGIVKEDVVPPREIDLAIKNRAIFTSDPRSHTYME